MGSSRLQVEEAVCMACAQCLKISRAAFPLKGWKELVVERKTDERFDEAFVKCVAVSEGVTAKDFTTQDVKQQDVLGMVVERVWTFMPVPTFESTFGCAPPAVGLSIDSITLDTGKTEKGVLVLDSDTVRLRTFHEVKLLLSDNVFVSESQLRAQAGSEVHAAWHTDKQKLMPKSFKSPDAASWEAVQERARKLIEDEKQKEAEKQAMEDALPTTNETQDRDAGEGDGDDDDDEAEEMVFSASTGNSLQLPSAAAALERKRRQNKRQASQGASQPGKKLKKPGVPETAVSATAGSSLGGGDELLHTS